MNLESELRNNKARKKLALSIPIASTAIGGFLGKNVENFANNYNARISSAEEEIQRTIDYYDNKGQALEQQITDIPGLTTWKNTYERIFGETSTETQTLERPEFSLQGLQAPDYSFPFLGMAIGFAYGITKFAGKISQLNREQAILERIR